MSTLMCEMPLNDKIFCAMLTIVSIFIIALVDRFRRPPQFNPNTIVYTNNTVLNTYIAKQLLELAIIKNNKCSITHEQYMVNNTSVTSCGHLFNTAALSNWQTTSHLCPMCKSTYTVNHI